jgi:hypothetical protein
MTGTLVATLSALAFTNFGLGWYLGYHSPSAYLTFWLLCGLATITAMRLEQATDTGRGAADRLIQFGVLGFGLVVIAGLLLGSLGWLTPFAYVIVFAGSCAATRALPRAEPRVPESIPDLPWLAAAVLVPLVAFIVAVGALQSPLTLYDSLSYHLYFPARWLLAHRLSIVPTPFSDPAQAYQPANGELFFLWLMAPFHGDLVARIGQLPFLLLGATAVYAIARRVGAPRDQSVVAVLLYLVARPVVEQAVGADVDLICSALFVTSLYLGIVAVDADRRRDWMMWGVSLGLFFGSKYLALVYAPIFLIFPAIKGVRPRALWALPGIALFALPWYLRNWIVAGSPIYPATVQLAGLVVARGAFTPQAMTNTVFHVTDVRLLPPILAHAFGVPLFAAWLPLAIVGGWLMLRRRPWWPAAYILSIPVLMVGLFWFALPVNMDSRFLLGAVAVAVVPLAFAFGTGDRSSRRLAMAACVVVLAWVLLGVHAEVPMSLPWFMGHWLTLDGLIHRPFVPVFVALGVAGGIAWSLSGRLPRYRPACMAALVGLAVIGLTRGSDAGCEGHRCDLLDLSSPYIRTTMLNGWEFVGSNVHDATIAYAGNNVPYPLFGDHLTNRVYYVSIDRHLDWRLHDYARVRRRSGASVPPNALARPSGELMPVREHAGAYEDASRPRYERMEGNRDAWVRNLRALGVDHLFVTSLSAYEIDNVWHDANGFPIEEAWARDDSRTFKLIYENEGVRVYDVVGADKPPAMP